MKKVGIVSCYFKHNYGSMLQAYATQKILDNMEIENETINIESFDKEIAKKKRKYYMSQMFNIPFIKAKFGMMKLKIDCKTTKKDLAKKIAIRNKKFKEFIEEFRLSKPYKTMKELEEKTSNYTDVIVGSDQLWLPVNVVADYYTLNFVPEKVNRISYSTSFGVSQIPKKYEEQYKKFLSRIDFLSVREEKGKKIIKDLIDRDVNVVCDPTLLLNNKEWMEIQKEEPIIKEKYILCYFLGKNVEHRKFAEKLREKTGFKIVSLNHLDEYVKYSDKFADIIPYDIGPGDFINLIRNAEYVCTDSFHGTIFSLINHKEFFVFRRYNNKSKVSTNSRLDSILNIVDLKERILEEEKDIDEILKSKIEYENVDKKLNVLIEDSKEFLKNALK